jgi:hypothetical protein
VSQGRRPIEFAGLKLSWMEQHFESMPWGFTMNVIAGRRSTRACTMPKGSAILSSATSAF